MALMNVSTGSLLFLFAEQRHPMLAVVGLHTKNSEYVLLHNV